MNPSYVRKSHIHQKALIYSPHGHSKAPSRAQDLESRVQNKTKAAPNNPKNPRTTFYFRQRNPFYQNTKKMATERIFEAVLATRVQGQERVCGEGSGGIGCKLTALAAEVVAEAMAEKVRVKEELLSRI